MTCRAQRRPAPAYISPKKRCVPGLGRALVARIAWHRILPPPAGLLRAVCRWGRAVKASACEAEGVPRMGSNPASSHPRGLSAIPGMGVVAPRGFEAHSFAEAVGL